MSYGCHKHTEREKRESEKIFFPQQLLKITENRQLSVSKIKELRICLWCESLTIIFTMESTFLWKHRWGLLMNFPSTQTTLKTFYSSVVLLFDFKLSRRRLFVFIQITTINILLRKRERESKITIVNVVSFCV